MNRTGNLIFALLLTASTGANSQAEISTLTGTCSLTVSSNANEVEFKMQRGSCVGDEDCHSNQTDMPLETFSGLTLADLQREGAHVDAVIKGEAGQIICSGVVHNAKLSGDYRFVPDAAFVARMQQMGFGDLDTEKLQAYTLFKIDTPWIRSLQKAGVSGIDSGNLIALRIFHVDGGYINSLKSLGYPTPDAGKLISLRVQRVDPEEVKQFRAMGYQPTLDELVQMRIFKVTPDFIRSMQARGFNNLTIAKLVQIRIFNLAE
jgi:hypothetical protein